ncbi:MAG: choice-of-anchor D domain-containing protein, partial [Acidobacteria bacterium]|nr:choice-of-anchor D domain-containing protein [Acidobacteriota bacterium]
MGDKELQPASTADVTVLDFFRFRPGTSFTTFPTAQRILASGGTQNFFGGGVELGMSTGRADNTGGDQEQASHWKANELTGVYIGVMDPTGARGEREQLTQNDLHAFDLIGYRVRSAVARIDASPLLFDFGSVALNASVERTLTVSNTGEQPLQVTGLTFSNAQFSRVSPAVPFTVAPNAQQAVVLRFTPTANGLQSGTLTLMSNDSVRPGLIAQLNGFGGARPTELALTAGVALTGIMPAPAIANDCQIDLTQYTIQVPTGATQLNVALAGNRDVDLYVRFGQRIGGTSPNWVADHVSDSERSTETVTVTPSSSPALRAGTYYVGITNCGPGAANFTLTATVTGGTAALAAVSAASFRGTELASESIASAFGTNLATETAKASTATLPTTLGGTTVRVRDSAGTERLAPLFFVSPGQINFLMPQGTALG